MATRQPRAIAPLTLQELKKLSTHRLLAYRNKLHACESSVSASDLEPHEVSVKGIVFKDSQAWKEQYALLKSVLADRPDI